MVYILPERLPALVRPAFDLVLRRIQSLKRCVQAYEQSGAQVTYPGFLLTSTCEFEGAHRLSSFSKVHQDLYLSLYKGFPNGLYST